MSVACSTWVWKHSSATGTEFLVLLALADGADDEGHNHYPSQKALAAKCRISERTVRRAVWTLENVHHELLVERPTARRQRERNRYSILMAGSEANLTSGQNCQRPTVSTDAGGHGWPIKQVQNVSTTGSPAPRPRDAVWDSFIAITEREPQTPSERSVWNAKAKEIRDALGYKAGQDDRYVEIRLEVRRRWLTLQRAYPHARVTIPSLAKHWGEVGPPVQREDLKLEADELTSEEFVAEATEEERRAALAGWWTSRGIAPPWERSGDPPVADAPEGVRKGETA
jgi:hypothetical protein